VEGHIHEGTIVTGRISQSPGTQTRRNTKRKTGPQDRMPEALTRREVQDVAHFDVTGTAADPVTATVVRSV
jgi:hypothetical protein